MEEIDELIATLARKALDRSGHREVYLPALGLRVRKALVREAIKRSKSYLQAAKMLGVGKYALDHYRAKYDVE